MLFVGVLVSGSVMAMGMLKVDVIPGKKEKALVDVLEVPNSQFAIKVKDSKGQIIYTDYEESPSYVYKKMYDFSDLKNGNYTFEVKLGDENDSGRLAVNNGSVQITGTEDQISPDFKLDGKFLEFTFANTTEKGARLLLYDKDTSHWIFQERLIPEFEDQQALNLSELKSGRYKAVLISGDERYDYNFILG